MSALYHFTCADHGLAGIGPRGLIVPNAHPLMPKLGPVVWLTSDPAPSADDVGLTSRYLSCDRMATRYRVHAPDVTPWAEVRHLVGRVFREDLERYGKPHTWFVSASPVRGVLA